MGEGTCCRNVQISINNIVSSTDLVYNSFPLTYTREGKIEKKFHPSN